MEREIANYLTVFEKYLDEADRDDLTVAEAAGLYAATCLLRQRIWKWLDENDIKARNGFKTKSQQFVHHLAVLLGIDLMTHDRGQHRAWARAEIQGMQFYLKGGEVIE